MDTVKWIPSYGHGQMDTVKSTKSYGHSHGCGHRHGRACPVISGGSSACVGGPLALCPCVAVPTVAWPTQLSGQGAVCRATTASARLTFLLWLSTAAPLGLARPPLEDVLPQLPHTIRLNTTGSGTTFDAGASLAANDWCVPRRALPGLGTQA